MGATGMACANSQFCFVEKAVCGEAGGLWAGRPWPGLGGWVWAARCPQGAPVCSEHLPSVVCLNSAFLPGSCSGS